MEPITDFNPRPARGATFWRSFSTNSPSYFNPRSREGSDTITGGNKNGTYYFNPRSREGSDLLVPWILFIYGEFQSTLPRGERLPDSCRMRWSWDYFNPRSREGSDIHRADLSYNRDIISIHAPARGATPAHQSLLSFLGRISIHAPARGATT